MRKIKFIRLCLSITCLVQLPSIVCAASLPKPMDNDPVAIKLEALRAVTGEAMRITPVGILPMRCVIAKGQNDYWDSASKTLIRSDGTETVIDTKGCDNPLPNDILDNSDANALKALRESAPFPSGWIEYANSTHTYNLQKIETKFSVPSKPVRYKGVTFLFPGLSRADGKEILQPVLQYGFNGAFGGNYFTIYSMYCPVRDAGDPCFESPTRATASPGDKIWGTVEGFSCSGTGCDWWVKITNESSPRTTHTARATGPHMRKVRGAVLESVSTERCDDLPGNFYVTNIKILKIGSATPVTPAWTNNYPGTLPCYQDIDTASSWVYLEYHGAR